MHKKIFLLGKPVKNDDCRRKKEIFTTEFRFISFLFKSNSPVNVRFFHKAGILLNYTMKLRNLARLGIFPNLCIMDQASRDLFYGFRQIFSEDHPEKSTD